MSDKHIFNSEREKRRKLNIVHLLEAHDSETKRIELLFDQGEVEEDGDSLNVCLEKLRDRSADKLVELFYSAEYTFRDTMRGSIRDLLQLADDVLAVNAEAEALSRTFELEANTPEQVRVEWMGEDFGKLVTNLAMVRRTVILGTALIGPDLAMRAAEHTVDRLFGPKPTRPSAQSNGVQTIRVEAPTPRAERNQSGQWPAKTKRQQETR